MLPRRFPCAPYTASMMRRILTAAVVAVAAGLALVPGVALAGNPQGAVVDSKILGSLVNNSRSSALFGDTADAVEEAILDSMIVNETMVGANGNVCVGLPREKLTQLLGL